MDLWANNLPFFMMIKRMELYMLELDFDETFVKSFYWSPISQAYTRVLHAQKLPKDYGYGCVLYCLL